jgi:hypothetical protein
MGQLIRQLTHSFIQEKVSAMRKTLLPASAYFLLALVLTFPLVLSSGHAVVDPVDPILNSWIMAWEHHALLTSPAEFFNTNIFYPYKETLLYSETLLVPSLLLLPIKLATGNALLTHNLLTWLGFTLTATGGYLLGRWLFRNDWSGWVLGGVLAFNSYTLSNVGQAQLLHLEWLPLAMLYLGKLLRVPKGRYALMMALFLALQFYTVIYYGVFGFMVVGLVGGVTWLLQAYPSDRVRLQAFGWFVGGLLGGLLLCLPLAIAYFKISESFGFERTLNETWPFSASLEMWFSAPANNLLYGKVFGNELPKLGFYQVDALFPGVLLIVAGLAGMALWLWASLPMQKADDTEWRWSRLRWPLLLIGGIGFFFLLSLGPYPHGVSLQPDFGTRLPYAWIHEWVPGFQALRAPGRFAIIVFLGLAIAAAYLFKRLQRRAFRMVLLLLLVIEMVTIPTDTLFTPTVTADQQAVYAWLATLPPTTFVELPVYPFGQEGQEGHWLESQFQSMRHWQKTPVGYSGFFPPRFEEMLTWLADFPRPEVILYLQASGIEWVVLHHERLAEEKWLAIENSVGENGWATQRFGDVWAVQLPHVELPQPAQSFFIPDVAQAGGTLAVGAIFTATAQTVIPASSDLGHVKVLWSQLDSQVMADEIIKQPPFFLDKVAVSSFNIPVPNKAGSYQVQIYGDSQTVGFASVNVVDDIAPPESVLVPVLGMEAEIVCQDDENEIQVLMQTIGWYDEPFTLSARVIDGSGREVARSEADVEFPAKPPRTHLLNREYYILPLAEIPAPEVGDLAVDIVAYRWQQEAERVVARKFVLDDGRVVDTLRLPLQRPETCEQ